MAHVTSARNDADTVRADWLALVDRHRGHDWERPDSAEFWATPLETASVEQLREMQGQRLAAAVQYAYACIPLYRRKFDMLGLQPGDIRGLDDLLKIPVTTKQEMGDDLAATPPWGTYTAVDDVRWRQSGWQTFASSGTTGQPRIFRYTAFDRSIWTWANARAMWSMGFRPDRDSALIAFGYGPHVWLWGVHYALNLMGIPIVTAGGLDSRARARFVATYQPTILAWTPSYALYLGHLMLELGINPARSTVRYLFCAGEPGFSIPATRSTLEELWGAELHEFYGCTEASPAAGGYTCAAVAADKTSTVSTHLMEDLQIWEAVDPDSLKPVPDGQRGLSVVTNLCSEASPQLRFLVGDFCALSHDRCACGRSHVRAVGGFVGRADDMLNIRGVTLFPSAVEDAVRRVPSIGEEFQMVVSRRNDLDVLTVIVEPKSEVPEREYETIKRRVETEIISRCELRPEVDLLPYGTLPKTEFKAKRLKDLRAEGTCP